jgi:hypothetical protein
MKSKKRMGRDRFTMESKKVTVDQVFYEDFNEYSQIKEATATYWYNNDGVDIYINRKNMDDINVSLTCDEIALLMKIFADMNF